MDVTDRTENLLGLILLQQMKSSPQRDKILQLSLAGFSNTEIADLPQTTSACHRSPAGSTGWPPKGVRYLFSTKSDPILQPVAVWP